MGVSYESLGTDTLWKKKLIFSSVFIEATKLQTAFDRNKREVSSKQWLLLVIASSFSEPPTLTEVGELMGCSRQNVKKIAVILEKKGYLTLTNIKDKRSLCIELANKYKLLSAEMEAETDAVMDLLFGEFTDDQVNEFFNGMLKLSKGIEALDKYFQKN
ncbi:MAG TPA: MarR family transcriptional regulator [Lachnospiraceae bacterium]|nr:MarR family transcriptional regulator [Lachnospiraceae bacterium]